ACGFVYFFFQAEDGIRDRNVTGVQTCALPILAGVFAIFGHGNVAGLGEALYAARAELPTLRAHNEQGMAHAAIAFAKAHRRQRRSEERRVGKEGRGRVAAYHETEKKRDGAGLE